MMAYPTFVIFIVGLASLAIATLARIIVYVSRPESAVHATAKAVLVIAFAFSAICAFTVLVTAAIDR